MPSLPWQKPTNNNLIAEPNLRKRPLLEILFRPSLDIITRIRLPSQVYLRLRKRLIDFLHIDQFFNFHYLTCHVLRDGVEDCCHSFLETEGVEDHVFAEGETDGGTHEGYAEVCHFRSHLDCEAGRICGVVWFVLFCTMRVALRIDERLRFCRLTN